MRRAFAAVGLAVILAFPAVAHTIDVHCWIVAEDDGGTPHTPSSISNCVEELNGIFSQVAMSFAVKSLLQTNSTHLTHIVLTDDKQIGELFSLARQEGGLEVYFIKTITGNANAFHTPSGIAVSSTHNRETTLVVTGMPTGERLPHGWGWYPPAVSQADVVRRLLMYGYDTSDKGDISSGDVYGLYYESEWNADRGVWERVWRLGNAPVGFGTRGSRHPASQ